MKAFNIDFHEKGVFKSVDIIELTIVSVLLSGCSGLRPIESSQLITLQETQTISYKTALEWTMENDGVRLETLRNSDEIIFVCYGASWYRTEYEWKYHCRPWYKMECSGDIIGVAVFTRI